MRTFLVIIIALATHLLFGQDKGLILHLSFNDRKEIPQFKTEEEIWGDIETPTTLEEITNSEFTIYGLAKYDDGTDGSAMKFDGFSSYIEGNIFKNFEEEKDEEEEFQIPDAISIEAWVALGAYPWNWAPIITIGKYKITGFYFGIDSRGRLGFHMSDATSVWHECNSLLSTGKKQGLDLKKWYHVAGTYSPQNGMKIYINGQQVYYYSGTRSFPDKELLSERVKVNIRQGENTLLVKSYQRFGRYDFCLNICEPETDRNFDGNRIWALKFKTNSESNM